MCNLNDRVMDSKLLSDQARRKRNEYQKEYRKKNPEKIKRYWIRYWEKQAEMDTNIQSKGEDKK